MSLNSEGIVLVTAGYDRTIRFWHPNTAVVYRTIMHEDSVGAKLKFSMENKNIFIYYKRIVSFGSQFYRFILTGYKRINNT